MDESFTTIHFHIGVDRVAEDVFAQLFHKNIRTNLDLNGHLISAREYSRYFRSNVDAARHFDVDNTFTSLRIDTNTIAFSRPRLLFSGDPMNSYSRESKPLYKLDILQQLFSSYKLIFHLIIIDQVSYLSRRKKPPPKLENPVGYSWSSLINAVNKRIGNPNKLFVWNAENPTLLRNQLFDQMFGMQLESAEPATESYFSESLETQINKPATEQLFDASYEEQLDMVFERDLQYISECKLSFCQSE